MQSVSEETLRREEAEDRALLQRTWELAARRPTDQLPAEETRPFDYLLPSNDVVDYTALINERRRHETPRAARCVRGGSRRLPDDSQNAHPDTSSPNVSQRQLLGGTLGL